MTRQNVPYQQILTDAIIPAFRELPTRMDTPEARVMMLAIGAQESRLTARVQKPLRAGMPPGPARGLWQFERGGGVKGVRTHRASSRIAANVLAARGIPPTDRDAWGALATDDVLAAIFARLLLWTDSRPLPRIGEQDEAWDCYIRNWRPGKPHARTWPALYHGAVQTITGA